MTSTRTNWTAPCVSRRGWTISGGPELRDVGLQRFEVAAETGDLVVVAVGTPTGNLETATAYWAGSRPRPVPLGGDDTLFTWVAVGDFTAEVAFLLDPLAAVMISFITGVGFLIHVYSRGYMEHDESAWRYFCYLNLFMGSMLTLILGNNMLLMFLGWEGVGLCSYLLIGFWYERKSATDAGKKAFVVNRIGDFGFLLGMFLVFVSFGTLDFTSISARAPEPLSRPSR